MIGLRHNVAQGGAFGGTGAARAANIGCLAVALAIVVILTVGLPLMAALDA